MSIEQGAHLRGRFWRQILQELVEQNEMWAAVLTDFQGLPFAAALHPNWRAQKDFEECQHIINILAAFAPPLLRLSRQMENYVGAFQADEISLRTAQGARIVSRFVPGEPTQQLILTVLVPPYQTYRRAMNQALRQLQHI